MKETTELVDASFDTFTQGVVSLRDGYQPLEDTPDFVDELMSWPNAIRGLNAMKDEASNATLDQVDALFARQREKMLKSGIHPMLAGAIESNMKGVYFVYASIVQKGEEVASEEFAKSYIG